MTPRISSIKIAALELSALARPAHAQSCGGGERWAVKVGSDAAAGTTNLTNAVTTTVHELVNVIRPTVPSDNTTRTTEERTLRVVDARLVKFKLEAVLTWTPSGSSAADLDLSLWRGTTVIARSTSVTQPESVSSAVSSLSGPYSLHVTYYSGSSIANYTLRVTHP